MTRPVGNRVTIPQTMRALELIDNVADYTELPSKLKLVEIPTPSPAPGVVLIQVAASPVHPSDLMFLKGLYGLHRPFPVTPGFEGSGIVVAGKGLPGNLYIGRKVAFASGDSGAWSEYTVAPSMQVIPLLGDITLTTGAMLFVNPLTALALMDIARSEHHAAIIQTAAGSALGKMIIRLATQANIPLINIVRRAAQVSELQSFGAKHVLDSTSPDFMDQLRSLAKQLKATIAFDAVSGAMTAQLLEAMPARSSVIVYGALSEGAVTLDPRQFIFHGKTITGFWLPKWLQRRNLIQQMQLIFRSQRLLNTELASHVRATVPLEEAPTALIDYAKDMSAGKLLIAPHGVSQIN
jgi:NADPH:quinone reductase